VGGYKRVLARIDRSNQAIARGEAGEFGRHITVRELKAEVPVHYLLNFSKDRAAEAVNRGVEAARAWCAANGIALRKGADYPAQVHAAQTELRFTEEFKGYAGPGAKDYHSGFEAGRAGSGRVEAHFAIHVDDVDRFITTPEHLASIEGFVTCELLGGKLPIQNGTFNLLVDSGDPSRKKVVYRVFFNDANGNPMTLSGFKDLHHDDQGQGDGTDPATVFTRIYRGKVEEAGEAAAEAVATGSMRVGTIDFLRQLATFRVEGATLADRTSALARFGAFYFGRLWDVYARRLLSTAPF
jgi:hypothetical protein